jgi:antitoxin CcdA
MRMEPAHEARKTRQSVNLSVNADLLVKARLLGINLSATFDRALEAELKQRLREQWRAVNEPAITAYNAEVEREGVFSDGLRSF